MKHLFYFRILFLVLLTQGGTNAQVSIINISVQPFNLTPEALLNVNIMNNGDEKRAHILTQLYNSNNTVLLTVKSDVFTLRKGMNAGNAGNRKVSSSEFSGSAQASYLRSTHNLASGRYKVCSMVLIENGSNEIDDFCEELEADFNQYLYLVNPFNGDTIDTKNPILSWTHSEPFTILNQGEFYRMIVTEMKNEQSAEEALTINTPAMVKNYVKDHQLQYPYDAKELKEGGRYAWQVQKISDGVVINKTEAWVFYTRRPGELRSVKYVAVKNQLDGSFYTAYDGLVYFKFSEEYKSQSKLNFSLTNDKSQPIDVTVKTDEGKLENTSATMLKKSGDNCYELDLNGKRLGSGFYTLEVKNEKSESFYLKIFLP